MTLDEIRYFVTVYEGHSITTAAEKLCISPQGLGKAIRKFEGELGVELFTRSTKGVIPNEEASAIYENCVAILREKDGIDERLRHFKRDKGVLRLLGRDSHVGDVIRQGVDDYNQTHPTIIETEFSTLSDYAMEEKFLDGDYDFLYINEVFNTVNGFPTEALFHQEFEPVVNVDDELAKRKSVALEDMSGKCIVAENFKFAHLLILQQTCRDQGIPIEFREVPEAYIHELLDKPLDYVYFARIHRNDSRFSAPGRYVHLKMEPPFKTTIVLQSKKGGIDPDLVDAIRHRLREKGFAVPSETAL